MSDVLDGCRRLLNHFKAKGNNIYSLERMPETSSVMAQE